MRNIIYWLTVSCTLALASTAGPIFADDAADAEALANWGQQFEAEVLPILRDRCLECHTGADADGSLDLARFTNGALAVETIDAWDEVGKRVRRKEMPPEGSPQLNDEQKGMFHKWLDAQPQRDLCAQLATDDTKAWHRGYVMSRRLTRTEYVNAIRDVTGVEVDPEISIASDGSGGEGFDTNGATLFTSPIHIEQYLQIATSVVGTMIDRAGQIKKSKPNENVAANVIYWPNDSADEITAAKQTIAEFARVAWRRPIESSEIDSLVLLYQAARNDQAAHNDEPVSNDSPTVQKSDTPFQTYVDAISQPLAAILVSPHFLFVVESEREGGVQRLSPHELAFRLSLLIWSSIPDDELLAAADADQLNTDEQIIAQSQRMLADPKARALGENFGLQWLALANFLTARQPDAGLFPQFNEQLAADMREEAVRFVAGIFTENRSLRELIDAPYVIVNGPLASHYGIELPSDAPWQTVSLSDARHGGVMTLGATLVSTSYPRRTSPVLRGRWVLEEILGDRVPPPPASVPALEEAGAEREMSLRERLELHRKNPECASCHNRMDPVGFGLENFDAIGRWRESDAGALIDSSGKLPSGEAFNGPGELKKIIHHRFGDFERHFVRKFTGFALGRELNEFDQCVIDKSLERLSENDHRAAIIIETIITSYPFQHRYYPTSD